ncbi:MAG: class I SAM-dependent methyltransferase [Nanoarchaeota archaeon]|nr:class I SAM-dependent methyltransferase [Nanoarchaeota archaeon]
MPTVWDKYWQETKFDNKKIIDNLKNSFFWKQLKLELLKDFGTLKDIKILELGSGRGEMSLLMALEGADITLVDESEFALKEAKKLYSEFNCKVNLIRKSMFDIKKADYDITISFGLAEHFTEEKRLEVFKKHYDCIKEKGLIILSVPNAKSFPYRIYKSIAQLLRFWKYGLEVPYTEKELNEIAKKLKIKNFRVIRSSFLNAFYHFLIINPLKLLGLNLRERFMDSKILNKYGYAIIFIGEK